MVWIIFTSQSTLILNPKIMLNLELVCDTLIRIFGVVVEKILEVGDQRSIMKTIFIMAGVKNIGITIAILAVFFSNRQIVIK
jgi:hypothetical protein